MTSSSQAIKNAICTCWTAVALLAASNAPAQSIDARSPSAVRANVVVGKIAARDLGDARLTDHFYAFIGTPGDVLITIQSANLNGDVDVFTAGTLKPLLKFGLYAESTSAVTKGIYLRSREDLILRVEARSPNDDEGTYQVRFGGSFAPIIGGPEASESDAGSAESAATTGLGKKTRRVSSVGARLEEPALPVGDVAVAPKAEPTPAESPSPEVVKEKPSEAEVSKPVAPTNARSHRPASRRTTTTATMKPKGAVTEKKTATTESTETPETETASKTPKRAANKRGTPPADAAKPRSETTAESGPRLIIQTNGGTLINRPMSSVRRVTVENGRVVVVGNDGKIDRIQLINIVRMSIEP